MFCFTTDVCRGAIDISKGTDLPVGTNLLQICAHSITAAGQPSIGVSEALLNAHTDLIAGFAMKRNADKNVSATCDALGQFNDNLREPVEAGNLVGEFNCEWIDHKKGIFGLSGEGRAVFSGQ